MADALGTPAPAATPTVGVVSDEDHRLALAGLVSPATSTLAVRTGVLVSPVSNAVVTGTSTTGTMTVNVLAHHWVTSRAAGDGIYLGTKETSTTVNIAAAPGSNSRIDVVYSKQNDSSSTISPDGSTGEFYGVVTGTAAASPTKPSVPVGATELATVQIAAGTTNTLGAGATITTTANQVVARGADVPVRTAAERDALTKYVGLTVKRLDDGARTERWTGSAWAAGGDIPILASITARNSYYSGNLRAGASALVANNLHVYDGGSWRFTLSGSVSNVTSAADGLYAIPHGGGATPRDWSVSLPQQPTDAISLVLKLVEWGADATNLTVRTERIDSVAWFSTLFNAKWRATF
jgi:hypothetical protein